MRDAPFILQGTVEFQEKHVLVDVSAPPVHPPTQVPESAPPSYAGTNGHSALSPAGVSDSQPLSPQAKGSAPAGGDPAAATTPDLHRTSQQSNQPHPILGRVNTGEGPRAAGGAAPAHPPGYGYGPQSSDLIGPGAAEAVDLVMESVYELCACVPLSGEAAC
jgi:hypothetical protein